VPIAQAKAAAKYGTSFDARRTIIIGDTPRDIEAARASGAHVIAIASGAFSEEQLAAKGAKIVLSSLHDLYPWWRTCSDCVVWLLSEKGCQWGEG
jgi:phosphoglycolate phosphatase